MFVEQPWYPSTAGRPLARTPQEFNEIGIYDHHYSQLSATGHGFSTSGLSDLNQWIPRLPDNHIQIGNQPKLVNDCGNMHDSSHSLSSGQATCPSSLVEVPVRTVTRGPDTAWYYPSMLSPWPGYPSHSRQINLSRTGKPLAIGALAIKIAKELQFLVDVGEWRLGPGFIQFEHIFLTEVLQVSKASLQPVLYVFFPGERVG
ncbi:predicted protein [Postia placenta Mad-698-R]|nr:predicted protein [Postia placenta Mad-698-R]